MEFQNFWPCSRDMKEKGKLQGLEKSKVGLWQLPSTASTIPLTTMKKSEPVFKIIVRVCLDHFAFCIFAFLEGNLQYLKY